MHECEINESLGRMVKEGGKLLRSRNDRRILEKCDRARDGRKNCKDSSDLLLKALLRTS